MNRDYFTTPIQGGRTALDYGNTHIQSDEKPLTKRGVALFLAFAFVFIAIAVAGSAVVS